MKPSCSRKGTPLELRVNKKREDQVRSEESSQESESSAADAQQKVRRWSSESTKSERIRSDRKNLLRSLSRQQQMPRAYSQLSLSLFSSFKSRKLQKVKVVPRLFTSHPHSYNNVITMLFTDDAIRGQLLFRFHNNTISLTKALIVETFEKNKNIFVSPIASSVNHCPKSKAKLIKTKFQACFPCLVKQLVATRRARSLAGHANQGLTNGAGVCAMEPGTTPWTRHSFMSSKKVKTERSNKTFSKV